MVKTQVAYEGQGANTTSPKKLAKLELERFNKDSPLEEVFSKLEELYSQVFDDSKELKPMIDPAYEMEMKNEPIKPFYLNVAHKMPFALREGARAELQRLIDKGILHWLEEGEVTDWLSSQ